MAATIGGLVLAASLWTALPGEAAEPATEGFHNRATKFYLHASLGASEEAAQCYASIKANHTDIASDNNNPIPYLTNVQADPCSGGTPSNPSNLQTSMSPVADSEIVVYLMPTLAENRSMASGGHIKGKVTFEITPFPNANVAAFDHFDINVSFDANGTDMGYTGGAIDGVDPMRITDTMSTEGSIIREVEFDLGEAPDEMPAGPATLVFGFKTSYNPPDHDRLGGSITLLVDDDNAGILEIPFGDAPPAPEPEPEPVPDNNTTEPAPTTTETAAPMPNNTTEPPTAPNNTTAPDAGDDKSLPAPGFVALVAMVGLLVAVAQRRQR